MFRLVFLCAVTFLPLWGECGIRTESEGQSSAALKDFGISQWLWAICRPEGSKFGYGFNARYLNFLTTQRVELTAAGTVFVGQGFVNLNPGRTTDGRWTTAIVAGYKLPDGWAVLALADPKWHHRKDLPTTVFKKLWIGKGPLYWRIDDFHVGTVHAYHYQGLEGRWQVVSHVELFVAPQVSVLGPKKFVAEFGIRTDFKIRWR